MVLEVVEELIVEREERVILLALRHLKVMLVVMLPFTLLKVVEEAEVALLQLAQMLERTQQLGVKVAQEH